MIMKSNVYALMSVAVAAGLLLSLLAIVPTLPSTSAATKTSAAQQVQSDHIEKFRISGKIAQAGWYIENGDGTITEAFISLVDAATKTEDFPPYKFLDVVIFQYEFVEECITYPDGSEVCYYDYVPIMDFYGFAELDGSEVDISNNLRSASADAIQVTGYDYVSGEEKTISVSASWVTDGSLLKIKRIFSQTDEDFKFTVKTMGTGREGTATAQISGDIDLTVDEGSALYEDASVLRIREGQMVRILNLQ